MNNFFKGLLIAVSIAFSSLAWAQNIAVFSPDQALFATQAAKQLGQQLSQQLQPSDLRRHELGLETCQQRRVLSPQRAARHDRDEVHQRAVLVREFV